MAADYENESERAEDKAGGEQPGEKDPRSSVRYWYEWLDDAKQAAKPHKTRADAAYRDYELGTIEVNGATKEKKEGGFGIYFSYSKHLEAAYYSQTPKANARRKFGIEDELGNTMALIIERLGETFLSADGFDSTVEKAVQDFIHADKACLQVVTEDDEPEVVELPVMIVPGPDGQPAAINQNNQPVPIEEVAPGPNGQYVQRIEEQNPKIYLLPIGYDEILHSPNADVEAQMKEKAYSITLDEHEVKKRFFGEERSTKLSWEELPWITSKADEDDPEEEPTKRLKIWEVVCADTKKIYWLTDRQSADFLDVRENTDELRARFPSTPFIISNTPKKGMYPTPVHTHVKPYLDALDALWERIADLIPKIERKAILDEKLAEAIDQLEETLDWVTVKNLAQMIEGTGDLRAMIQFLPLQELVQSIQEASNLIDFIARFFNEHGGLPDVLRGQADPMNAAATNQLMAQGAHDRFKKNKRAVQTMVRDALELEIDMALLKWSDRKIWRVTGFDYAEPAHQMRFAEALQRLRDDEERFIRIDIETNSTSFQDEAAEFQKAQALNQLITQGLGVIGGAQNVEFIPILVDLLLEGVEALGGNEKHADQIRQSVDLIVQKKQQQAQQQQQDPAVAAKAQEQQTKLQVAQLQGQVDMAEAQMDMQQHQSEMPLRQAELQLKLAETQLEREKIQLEYVKLGQERQLRDLSMMEQAAKTMGAIEKEKLDTEQAEIDFAGKVATATSQNLQHMTPRAGSDGGAFGE